MYFFPYYRYQNGGPALPAILTNPIDAYRVFTAQNPNAGDLRSYYHIPSADTIERDLEAIRLQQQAKQREAAAQAASQKAKNRPAPNPQINAPAKPDIASYYHVPTQEEAEQRVQVAKQVAARTQHNLERLGYNPVQAAYFAQQPQDKRLKTVQQQLDDQAVDDYRVRQHPDFDPGQPVEDQQQLNYDNSLRTRLLRGRNMLVDTGNPLTNFLAQTITGPGKSFVNLTMDGDKQYFKPGFVQGAFNLGNDLLAVLPSPGTAIANKLVGAGLPEASLLMEKQIADQMRYAAMNTGKNAANQLGKTKSSDFLSKDLTDDEWNYVMNSKNPDETYKRLTGKVRIPQEFLYSRFPDDMTPVHFYGQGDLKPYSWYFVNPNRFIGKARTYEEAMNMAKKEAGDFFSQHLNEFEADPRRLGEKLLSGNLHQNAYGGPITNSRMPVMHPYLNLGPQLQNPVAGMIPALPFIGYWSK